MAMTRFWKNLHRVCSKSKYWEARKLKKNLGRYFCSLLVTWRMPWLTKIHMNFEFATTKSNTPEKMCLYIPSKRCICSNGNKWMEFLMYVQNWIIVLPGSQNDAGCVYWDPSDHSKLRLLFMNRRPVHIVGTCKCWLKLNMLCKN